MASQHQSSSGRIGFMLDSLAPRKHMEAQDTNGSAETLMNLMILKELKMAVSCCVLDVLNDRASAVC